MSHVCIPSLSLPFLPLLQDREFVFVGIHCRRTDHINFELERNIKPLKYSYFLEAMDIFREEFGKTHNLVFVFVSTAQSRQDRVTLRRSTKL